MTLEHLLPYKYPLLGKLTLSKSHWRPIRLTIENPGNHRLHWRYELKGYRQYEEGIYFPSEIQEIGTSEAGEVRIDTLLTLQTVQFNESVDTSRLSPPVPKGTQIADFRFGEQSGVTYRVEDHIPSDDEVRVELKRQQDALNKQNTSSKAQLAVGALSTALIAGAGGRMIGILRRKRKTSG